MNRLDIKHLRKEVRSSWPYISTYAPATSPATQFSLSTVALDLSSTVGWSVWSTRVVIFRTRSACCRNQGKGYLSQWRPTRKNCLCEYCPWAPGVAHIITGAKQWGGNRCDIVWVTQPRELEATSQKDRSTRGIGDVEPLPEVSLCGLVPGRLWKKLTSKAC